MSESCCNLMQPFTLSKSGATNLKVGVTLHWAKIRKTLKLENRSGCMSPLPHPQLLWWCGCAPPLTVRQPIDLQGTISTFNVLSTNGPKYLKSIFQEEALIIWLLWEPKPKSGERHILAWPMERSMLYDMLLNSGLIFIVRFGVGPAALLTVTLHRYAYIFNSWWIELNYY